MKTLTNVDTSRICKDQMLGMDEVGCILFLRLYFEHFVSLMNFGCFLTIILNNPWDSNITICEKDQKIIFYIKSFYLILLCPNLEIPMRLEYY